MVAVIRHLRLAAAVVLLVMPGVLSGAAKAAPWGLDPTFGSSGATATDFGRPPAAGMALALQGDGGVLVAGTAGAPGLRRFALARYTAAGRLDPAFGAGGLVLTNIGSGEAEASDMVLQPDGKILVAGTSVEPEGTSFAVVRYLPNGGLDTSFDENGRVRTAVGSGSNAAAAIALQPDGRIVVAGRSTEAGSPVPEVAVARYLTDGKLDETFSSNGVVTTTVDAGAGASAVALQPDGKVVVSGFARPPAAGGSDFAILRYLADGRLDPTFGAQGKVQTRASGLPSGATDLALQRDGRIVAVGSARYESTSPPTSASLLAIARYSVGGAPEGRNGEPTMIGFEGEREASASALALDPADGQLIAAGAAGPQIALARFGGDPLALVPGFDFGGRVLLSLGSAARADAVEVAVDRKLLVAGSVTVAGVTKLSLARLQANPPSPPPLVAFAGSRSIPTPGGVATLTLGCGASAQGACNGQLALYESMPGRSFGKAFFTIPAGLQGQVAIRLNNRAKRALRKSRRVRASALAIAQDGAGVGGDAVREITLRR